MEIHAEPGPYERDIVQKDDDDDDDDDDDVAISIPNVLADVQLAKTVGKSI